MLKRAYDYLQKLARLSPDREEAIRIASRMFILLQGVMEGTKISLANTTVPGQDVIKDLLVNNSYEIFKSIARAMGTQYQLGFNDGKMFAQSKEGLQKTGIFSLSPSPMDVDAESVLTSPATMKRNREQDDSEQVTKKLKI